MISLLRRGRVVVAPNAEGRNSLVGAIRLSSPVVEVLVCLKLGHKYMLL